MNGVERLLLDQGVLLRSLANSQVRLERKLNELAESGRRDEGGESVRMTAEQVASYLGRSRSWVYRNKTELSARYDGDGKRPRVYFLRERVEAYARGQR
jgi:hypothetical protein